MCVFSVCFCVLLFLVAPFMPTHLVLVHVCLSVLLSLMSHIVCTCTIIFELINGDDDFNSSFLKILARFKLWLECSVVYFVYLNYVARYVMCAVI